MLVLSHAYTKFDINCTFLFKYVFHPINTAQQKFKPEATTTQTNNFRQLLRHLSCDGTKVQLTGDTAYYSSSSLAGRRVLILDINFDAPFDTYCGCLLHSHNFLIFVTLFQVRPSFVGPQFLSWHL